LIAGGIWTVEQFEKANISQLRSIFHSINGQYWYLRLKGWEIDDYDTKRKSLGHSFTLAKMADSIEKLTPIICKLSEKIGLRLRGKKMTAGGLMVSIVGKERNYWHWGKISEKAIWSDRQIIEIVMKMMARAPIKDGVRNVAITAFGLKKVRSWQMDLFGEVEKEKKLTAARDKINRKWGWMTITAGETWKAKDLIKDRIGFGRTERMV
jgi:DNA polymerase-4